MPYHSNNYSPGTPVSTPNLGTSTGSTDSLIGSDVSNVITKMGYSHNDFKLSGVNYTGYFNIRDDGSVFKGKFTSDEILTTFNNIKSEIYLNDELYFDRTIEDTIALPFDRDSIKFAPNELVNRNSLNDKIENLYDNFLELYRFSVLSLPKLPINRTYFAASSTNPSISGDNGTTNNAFVQRGDPAVCGPVVWVENNVTDRYKATDLQSLPGYNQAFNGINESLNLMNNDLSSSFTLFASVSNVIFTYEIDRPEADNVHRQNSFNFLTSATNFGNFNELTFENISNTTDDGDKVLFVADNVKNTVYKFDVSEIVKSDRTGQKTFKLLDSMGGTSLTGADYNYSFSNLIKIEFVNDHLYTYDSGKKEVKRFTKEFAFKNRYKNNKFFTDNNVVAIKVNPFDKKLYLLCQNFQLLILNADTLEIIDNYVIFPDLNRVDFTALDLLFSTNDSNIFYVLTTIGVYKGFVSRVQDGNGAYIAKLRMQANGAFVNHWEDYNRPPPGASSPDRWQNKFFNWNDRPDIIPLAGANLDMLDDFEKIYFISENCFVELTENSGYVNLTNENFPYFSRSEVKVKDDYFNAYSLNSSFYRILYNTNLLSKNLNKFLTATYDRQELIFDSFSNIAPGVANNIELIDQNEIFIGNNETINIDVFNRTVNKLYDYQNLLLSAYEVKMIGTKLPPLSTVPLQ